MLQNEIIWGKSRFTTLERHGNPKNRLDVAIIGDGYTAAQQEMFQSDVDEIDGRLAKLCDDMLTTMYDAPGLGLAAPQVWVQKRFFVYDFGE